VPTDEQRASVYDMAKYGVPHEHIASTIGDNGINSDTLKKHFSEELLRGKAEASAAIGKTLFEKARGGCSSSLIWWSKSQMGWRGESLDVSSTDGTMTPQIIERVIVKADAK
jgi:hypothetical protein